MGCHNTMKRLARDQVVRTAHWNDRYSLAPSVNQAFNCTHYSSQQYRQPRPGCDSFTHECDNSGQRLLVMDVAECSFEERMQYVQQLCGREPSSGDGQLGSTRRWIDLVYPRDVPVKSEATCFHLARGWMDKSRPVHPTMNKLKPLRHPKEKELGRTNMDRGNEGRHRALEHCPQTFLVAETGEWRKRQLSCLCRHQDCPGVSQQRGTAYMLARVQRMSTGVERFWHIGDVVELKMGVQATSTKHGFHLATSASAALQLRPQNLARGMEKDTIVLRGCVTGLGCKRGNYLWCSTFRPVCAVDFVVTRFQ